MFKKNSEQQKEWMRRKLISHSPEEVNLNNSDLLDKCLKKIFKEPIVKVQTMAYSFCLFYYFFF